MNITLTVELDTKQARAFNKRINGGTPENLAKSIVVSTAQMWADGDYHATSEELIERLKSKPQEVLDSITEQLSTI